MEEKRMMQAAEALLFISAKPLSAEKLSEVLGINKEDSEQLLLQLQYDYERDKRGIRIRRIAGAYQMVTALEISPYLEKFNRTVKRLTLSSAALESLAIIAYRQPITRSEIDQIRGVRSEKAVLSLLEKNLICEVGRKETIGKPIIYGTTKCFLEHFGLDSLNDLPPFPEGE